MKYLFAIVACLVALAVTSDAQAVGRRNVSVQKVVTVNRVQRVRVQQVVVAQPVVAVQAFHAPVQAFVAPTYGVQAFSAGHCQQQVVAPVQAFSAGHCQSFFAR